MHVVFYRVKLKIIKNGYGEGTLFFLVIFNFLDPGFGFLKKQF
jgi:hypothetical protein